jgi:hypothetical protein
MATFGTTIGSGGLRFYDAGHEVSYNYVTGIYGGLFQNALMLDSGDAEGSSTALDAHWRVLNALVEKNVLVGNPTGIVIGHNYSLAPSGCTIRDNVVAQAANGVAVFQKIAPVSTTITNNAYASTPPAAGLAQDSTAIWRRAGVGPRLTYLQPADVGITGDPNDTDGTGTLISGGGTTPPPATDTAASKFGWGNPLSGSDEFEYSGAPDSTKWGVYNSTGHAGNGVRSPARVTVTGGKMVLTGLDGSANTAGLEHKLNQTYGRWEIRARSFYTGDPTAPGNKSGGYHPVAIIWSDDASWPAAGEYDFMENGEPGEQTADGFMHYPSLNGTNYQVEVPRVAVDLRQFHNFAFEWTPSGLTGWIDGVAWFNFSGGAVSGQRKNIQDMPSGHLTLQLDAFQATGLIASTMELEWARVYSLTPSGPTTGPQTVTTVGITSAERIGIATVTGASPAPQPGSTPTVLGTAVLGTATLGYTAPGGGGGPLPGGQSVTGAGGITYTRAFGVPALSVEDGPQTIIPGSVTSAEAFGRPRLVGGASPAPAPGGVLVPTLFAVAADGQTLTPLPFWTKISISPVRNSPGSLSIEYPAGAPGSPPCTTGSPPRRSRPWKSGSGWVATPPVRSVVGWCRRLATTSSPARRGRSPDTSTSGSCPRRWSSPRPSATPTRTGRSASPGPTPG